MKVNDRVTVKTDGGPRRPGVVLAIEEFSEGTMYLVSLEDYPLGIWFLTNWGIRTVFLSRRRSSTASGSTSRARQPLQKQKSLARPEIKGRVHRS